MALTISMQFFEKKQKLVVMLVCQFHNEVKYELHNLCKYLQSFAFPLHVFHWYYQPTAITPMKDDTFSLTQQREMR